MSISPISLRPSLLFLNPRRRFATKSAKMLVSTPLIRSSRQKVAPYRTLWPDIGVRKIFSPEITFRAKISTALAKMVSVSLNVRKSHIGVNSSTSFSEKYGYGTPRKVKTTALITAVRGRCGKTIGRKILTSVILVKTTSAPTYVLLLPISHSSQITVSIFFAF